MLKDSLLLLLLLLSYYYTDIFRITYVPVYFQLCNLTAE